MFGQKYQKQMMRFYCLTQQQGEQQSVQPSHKHNSNDEESEECFTPNYNAIEDEEEKPYQLSDSKIQKNYNTGYDGQSDNQIDTSYQRMRQNPHIDYESLFNKKSLFASNENLQIGQSKQKIAATGGLKQEQYDFSPVNSSFQNLMDSNFKKNQSGQEKQIQNNTKQGSKIEKDKKLQSDQFYYQQVTINDQLLTNDMLNDPQIRWKLIFQLLSLQNGQKSINGPPISDIIQKIFLQINDQKKHFQMMEKTVEQKSIQAQQLIEYDLEKQVNRREKKQFLALYRYQQTKNSIFEKFQEKAGKSISSLEESVGKKFQKANLQLIRAKRLSMNSIETDFRQLIDVEQKLSLHLKEFEQSHNQSVQKIDAQFSQKFTLIELEISSVKRQIKSKECIIEQNIDKINDRVMTYLNKEIIEAKQIQQQLTKLLLGLIDKFR